MIQTKCHEEISLRMPNLSYQRFTKETKSFFFQMNSQSNPLNTNSDTHKHTYVCYECVHVCACKSKRSKEPKDNNIHDTKVSNW